MSTWPFSDPKNVATFTVRQIVELTNPILLVCRDEEDGGWQFLTGKSFEMKDATLVSLNQILSIDPSIAGVADLQAGWEATRPDQNSPWHKQQSA